MPTFYNMREISPPDGRENKLPKWAQDQLQQLRWAAEEREKALNRQVQAEKSRVQIAYDKVYFPDHTTFAFNFGENDEIHVGFNYRMDKLRVSATGGSLLVLPDSSNTISVKPDRR